MNTVVVVHHDLEIPENLERARARSRSSTARPLPSRTTVASSAAAGAPVIVRGVAVIVEGGCVGQM